MEAQGCLPMGERGRFAADMSSAALIMTEQIIHTANNEAFMRARKLLTCSRLWECAS